jgi:hypothetical protein
VLGTMEAMLAALCWAQPMTRCMLGYVVAISSQPASQHKACLQEAVGNQQRWSRGRSEVMQGRAVLADVCWGQWQAVLAG